MFSLFRYKKNGLPSGLIKLHEFLLEDIILYFEKGKFVRKRVREARKAIKQALRFAKKKKIYPSQKTTLAYTLMEELYEETDYTRQVLKEAAIEMEHLITQIEEERVLNTGTLIDNARQYFLEKEFEKGMTLLKQAQNQLEKKSLSKTRKTFLTNAKSEIKKIKHEIEKKQKQ